MVLDMTGEYKDYMNDRIKKEKAIISEYPFLRIRDIDGSIDVKSKYLLIRKNGYSEIIAFSFLILSFI